MGLALLQRSRQLSHPSDSIVRKLYALESACCRQLGRSDEALRTCQEGRRYYPQDAGLLFEEGKLHKERRDYRRAEPIFLALIHGSEGPHFASLAANIRQVLARQELGTMYLDQGRFAEGEAQFRAIIGYDPNYQPAWQALAAAVHAQGRHEEAEAIRQQIKAAAAA